MALLGSSMEVLLIVTFLLFFSDVDGIFCITKYNGSVLCPSHYQYCHIKIIEDNTESVGCGK